MFNRVFKRTVVLLATLFSVSSLAYAQESPSGKTGLLVAGGYPGSQNLMGMIQISEDGGATWEEVWYSDQKNTTISDIAYSREHKKFVAVGRVGILTSDDGREWRQTLPTKKQMRGVTSGGGYFVAVGSGTNIFFSKDGETWTHVIKGYEGYQKGGKENTEIYNKNKTEWSKNVFGASGTMHYYDVAYADGKFIVTGSYDRALILEVKNGHLDFVSDVRNTQNPLDQARKVLKGKSKLFIFGRNRSYASKDGGATWKRIRKLKANADIETAVYTPETDKYVIGGQFGDVYVSTGGKKWEKAKKRSRLVWDVAYGAGTYFAVTNDYNKIMLSNDGMDWKPMNVKQSEDAEEEYNLNFLTIEYVDLN